MIGFWIVAALLLTAALAVLLRPLLRQAAPEPEADLVAELFRRQLTELEADVAQGRLAAEEAEAARAEAIRRMLAEAERRRAAAPASGRGDRIWRFATAAGLASLVPAGALAVYYAVGMPAAVSRLSPGGPAAPATEPHSAAELEAAAARLETRVKQAPGDLDSRVMLARTLAALGRFSEAEDAFHQAIALAPSQPELHVELGQVLVFAAQGRVTPAAAAEFAKAPDDPRARYYEAAAAAQRGDVAGAKRALEALLSDAPADAPWRKAVVEGLRALSPPPPRAAAPASPAPPAPAKAADPAAMVAKLAARLEQQPGDVAGWLMLARSYRVLGRDADALDALRRANRHVPGNLVLLQHYLDALAAGLADGKPTPELVDVARRINALDANEPDALWYLGLSAQERGDRFAAARYWMRLVSELPSGSSERAVVQQKLDSLR